MQRRDFLKVSIAAIASSLLPVSAFAGRGQQVTWAPYQNLDLDPEDMVSDEEREAQGLPDYVALRDGGIRAIYDEWYGSWVTNWKLATLVAKGALVIGD